MAKDQQKSPVAPTAARPAWARGWLLTGVVLLLLLGGWQLWARSLVLEMVLKPNLSPEEGLRVENFSEEGLKGTRSGAPSAQGAELSLQQPHSSQKAIGFLIAPRPGSYFFRLEADDYGALHLDGLPVVQLGGTSSHNQGEGGVYLGAGPHLLELELDNTQGRGWLHLTMREPGAGDFAPIPGSRLHRLDLGNAERWLAWLRGSRHHLPWLLAGLTGLLLGLAALRGRESAPGPATTLAVMLAAAVVFTVFFQDHVAASLARQVFRDEHQFIASAVVWGRQDAWPYLDFPYFHVPYLIPVYWLLFSQGPNLLEGARIMNAVAGGLAGGALFFAALREFSRRGTPWLGLLLATGLACLYWGSPLFRFTSGLAWNHDISILLALLAFLIHWRVGREGLAAGWLAASGALLGLAACVRLTMAPLGLPFLLLVLCSGEPWRVRLRGCLFFLGGGLAACLPLLIILASHPEATWFGNLEYPGLHSAYKGGVSLGDKLVFLWRAIILPPAFAGGLSGLLKVPVTLLTLLLTLPGLALAWRGGDQRLRRIMFALGCSLLALAASLAPNPPFPQYFLAPVPFLLLALIPAWTILDDRLGSWRAWRVAGAVGAMAAVWFGLLTPGQPPCLDEIPTPELFHQLGLALANQLPDPGCKVLSLTPIPILEGGAAIYPELVSEPFCWRITYLVSPERRPRLHILGPEELSGLSPPPAAILTGYESEKYEAPLEEYARSLGYQARALPGGGRLWLP